MVRPRVAGLLALLAASCAHGGPRPTAPPVGVRLAVDLGERGEVVFQVPSGWKVTSGEAESGSAASISGASARMPSDGWWARSWASKRTRRAGGGPSWNGP